ncbi:MAG TPA: ABC transporter permease [Gemmatimonadaceae bacterium]
MISTIRSAARSLLRSPTVAISGVLCLALGIGATAAISSAISRALFQSLPFREPARLVAVHRTTPHSGPFGTWPLSAPNYIDLAQRTRRIEGLAALSFGRALVALPTEAVPASQIYVTGNFFNTLGARAQVGRLLVPDDDRVGQAPVAVVSDEFWRGKLGADPSIVGKRLGIDGAPTTIVGIAPRDFHVPHGANVLRADLWTPIQFTAAQLAANQRRSNYLLVLGRLTTGATPVTAQTELRTIFAGIVAENPVLHGEDVRVAPLQAENVAAVRTPLLLLLGAVGMVLLIAATNVAALLLARGVQRRREIAVRTALGATRWATMQPAFVESLIITGIGVALGLAIAAGGVRTIGALAGAQIPQLAGLSIDGRVVLFALGLALVVAAACGVLPAWRSAAVDPQDALRGGRGGGAGREQHRALRTLVVLEIALSLVLLIGAGLVLKGFAGLLGNDPGFETAHVLTLRVTTSPARYAKQPTSSAFLEPALEAIRALPGVESAGSIDLVPYVNWGNNWNVRYEGKPEGDPTRFPVVENRRVSPGFFDVTGQRLLAGRLLRLSDDASPTTPVVAVVNQALVDRDLEGVDPIGKRFHLTDTTFGTIVGVVTNIRNLGPIAPPAPEMYWTYAQGGQSSTFSLMIRVRRGDPAAIAPSVRAAIRALDPTAAVAAVLPMPEVIAASLGQPRFYLSLLGAFAAVALLLSIAGLYGVLSYAVAQRTRELGIRAALGSSASALLRLMTADGLRLVAIGLVLGSLGGVGLTRFVTFALYGVSPLDAATWVAALALMLVAGLLATLVPARRATRVNPMIAIQAE